MSLIFFCSFQDAVAFLKKVKAGRVQRRQDNAGFLWDSEQAPLSQEQVDLVAEASGQRYVWTDVQTGLTWLIKRGLYREWNSILHPDLNERQYGGFSDWRVPTLRELKTLSASEPDEFGVYVKGELRGRLKGNYESCSEYYSWHDRAWWDFSNNRATREERREGKIQWGSEGEYVGFGEDRVLNSAALILVRGVDTHHREEWALRLIEWAESQNIFRFPVTQQAIEMLAELRTESARSLPPEISRLHNLKKLTYPSHKEMQDQLFENIGLVELEIVRSLSPGQRMEALPAAIGKLRNLVSLRAPQIGLKSVHPAIGDLSLLEHLDLWANEIESIPDSIGALEALKNLNLAGNNLEAIPAVIGRLVNLESLGIGGRFSELPDAFGAMSSLARLHCTAPIAGVPKSLLRLEKLRSLSIWKAADAFDMRCLLPLHQLTSLSLRECPLECIPDEVSGMNNLEELDLYGTRITELPRSLLALENLKKLVISNARLESLPDWLMDMKSLKLLDAKGLQPSREMRQRFQVRTWQ